MKDIWLTWEELNRKLIDSDFILFGQGPWALKTMNKLSKKPISILDNNISNSGTELQDVDIKYPSKGIQHDSKHLILITTVSYTDVMRQLESYGYTPGVDLFCSPVLVNNKITEDLKNNDQTLLFTCSDSGQFEAADRGSGVYTFDIQKQILSKHHSGRCQEIIKTDDFYYIAEEAIGVLCFNKNLELIKTYENPKGSAIHGLAYDATNNLLYVANTPLDAIMILDLNTGVYVDHILISRENRKGEKYRHHINDLTFKDGSLYVSMFSFTGNWKEGIYDGGVLKIDPETKTAQGQVITNLWMPHSVDFINEELVVCDSMRGDVYRTSNRVMASFPGFIRGITHDGIYYYVAQSEHRYYDRLRGHQNVISVNCGIHVFDEVTRASRFYAFNQLSNIHCVEILDR